jgi:hypothetical protein
MITPILSSGQMITPNEKDNSSSCQMITHNMKETVIFRPDEHQCYHLVLSSGWMITWSFTVCVTIWLDVKGTEA